MVYFMVCLVKLPVMLFSLEFGWRVRLDLGLSRLSPGDVLMVAPMIGHVRLCAGRLPVCASIREFWLLVLSCCLAAPVYCEVDLYRVTHILALISLVSCGFQWWALPTQPPSRPPYSFRVELERMWTQVADMA